MSSTILEDLVEEFKRVRLAKIDELDKAEAERAYAACSGYKKAGIDLIMKAAREFMLVEFTASDPYDRFTNGWWQFGFSCHFETKEMHTHPRGNYDKEMTYDHLNELRSIFIMDVYDTFFETFHYNKDTFNHEGFWEWLCECFDVCAMLLENQGIRAQSEHLDSYSNYEWDFCGLSITNPLEA